MEWGAKALPAQAEDCTPFMPGCRRPCGRAAWPCPDTDEPEPCEILSGKSPAPTLLAEEGLLAFPHAAPAGPCMGVGCDRWGE